MRAIFPVLALTIPFLGMTRAAAEGTEPKAPEAASAPSASVSAAPSSSIPLRKSRPAPTEVEVIDLSPDRDAQALAFGAQLGAGMLAVRYGGPVQMNFDVALVVDIGLGPGGARTPWTLEPWIAFAMPYNLLVDKRGYPNRFTEIGVRIVHRWADDSVLAHRWVSLGTGLVWSNTKPSSGLLDPRGLCTRNEAQAAAEGLDCSRSGEVAPGLLVDLGIGLHETVIRRARWGFGVRAPLQISKTPGVMILGFFYAQVGTAM